MSVHEFDIDKAWPEIDTEAVTPSIDEVAILERSRTNREDGTEVGTFDSTTWPSDVDVQELIGRARSDVLTDLPDRIPARLYDRVKNAIALKAAILIETSFFRVQTNQGSSVPTYQQLLADAMSMLEQLADTAGRGGGRRVDSVVVRGTGTEYDPTYPLPPHRIVTEQDT